jgi:hypothetical protein
MTWKRIRPGLYEIYDIAGHDTMWATVERSTSHSWLWWWKVWGQGSAGCERGLTSAKMAAESAMVGR